MHAHRVPLTSVTSSQTRAPHASRSLTGVTLSTYGLSGSDSQLDRVKEMRIMALFGQQTRKDDGFPRSEDRVEPQVEVAPYLAPVPHVPARSMEDTRPTMTTTLKNSESILAAGLTIEGKIECN